MVGRTGARGICDARAGQLLGSGAAIRKEFAPTIRFPRIFYRDRARDAYSALAYLKSLPFVDPNRIGG